jgi:hypothetical protein
MLHFCNFAPARHSARGLPWATAMTYLHTSSRRERNGQVQTIEGNPPDDCRTCFTDAMVQGTLGLRRRGGSC